MEELYNLMWLLQLDYDKKITLLRRASQSNRDAFLLMSKILTHYPLEQGGVSIDVIRTLWNREKLKI